MIERPAAGVHADERGIALVLVLLGLIVVTALASAGFLVARMDGRVSDTHRMSARAFHLAQEGLARYLAAHDTLTVDTTYVFGQDTADVSVRKLMDLDASGEERVFEIVSRGVDVLRGRGRATRTVRQLVVDAPTRLTHAAALAGAGGIDFAGSAEADGRDECGAEPDVAGVAVPAGGYSGSTGNLDGSPPLDDSWAAGDSLLNAIGVEWTEIQAGLLAPGDYVVPADAWPDFSGIAASEWPVIRITASDFTVGGSESGWGTIIAENDLSISGSFDWDGLILAGGRISGSGNGETEGVAVAGLDDLTGGSPATSSFGTGNIRFNFDSCNARAAARRAFRRVADVAGTWTEII